MKLFFVVQALVSIDWCHYKYTERVLPFLELGFFIPFSITDPKQRKKFVSSILKKTRQQMINQCAECVGKETVAFTQELLQIECQSYWGPFLICKQTMWEQLQLFACQTSWDRLVDCDEELTELKN